MYRNHHFFVHSCDIERATIAVGTSTIRDRKVTDYVKQNTYAIPCWFEPAGIDIVPNAMMGSVAVERYTVHFEGDIDVRVNDRLVKGSDYYLVEGLSDYDHADFQKACHVRKLNLASA